MKGIYLASYKANHPNYEIVYQDINGKRDIGGEMMDVDLSQYDYIIATPPCNWWSRANYRRDKSPYALQTKHLLIDIINKLTSQEKPFIVENVKNDKQFSIHGLMDIPNIHVYKIGRHTYWSNIYFDTSSIIQKPLVEIRNGKRIWLSSQQLPRNKRQGGKEVHEVIERFLEVIHEN